MEYTGLTDEDRQRIRAQHCLELEARLFQLQLHEEEEPGGSPDRTLVMAEIGSRVEKHRALLAPARDADPEPDEVSMEPER